MRQLSVSESQLAELHQTWQPCSLAVLNLTENEFSVRDVRDTVRYFSFREWTNVDLFPCELKVLIVIRTLNNMAIFGGYVNASNVSNNQSCNY